MIDEASAKPCDSIFWSKDRLIREIDIYKNSLILREDEQLQLTDSIAEHERCMQMNDEKLIRLRSTLSGAPQFHHHINKLQEEAMANEAKLAVIDMELNHSQYILRRQACREQQSERAFHKHSKNLKERYVSAKKGWMHYDLGITQKCNLLNDVLSEQRHEIEMLNKLLNTIKRTSKEKADAFHKEQNREMSDINSGITSVISSTEAEQDQHIIFEPVTSLTRIDNTLKLPTAESRVLVPPGRLRLLTQQNHTNNFVGLLHYLRNKCVVFIAVVQRSESTEVVVAGHTNGVNICVDEINAAISQWQGR